jgi:hypothetical protein
LDASLDRWRTRGQAIGSLSPTGSGSDCVIDQARLLGLPTRMARSDLQVVRSHQRVLASRHRGTVSTSHPVHAAGRHNLGQLSRRCSSWQKLTLAGIVGLDLAAPRSDFVLRVEIEDLKDAAHLRLSAAEDAPVEQRRGDLLGREGPPPKPLANGGPVRYRKTAAWPAALHRSAVGHPSEAPCPQTACGSTGAKLRPEASSGSTRFSRPSARAGWVRFSVLEGRNRRSPVR